ncbi:MAG: MFS transporter [Firmicutes bacterium]|nr:MFS transporter [Bacillota bacterium]
MKNTSPFNRMDQMPFGWFQWKMTLITGMGVFTDGYDLSSIGIVLPLALATFGVKSLTGLQSSMLVAAALVGAVVGGLVFGLLGNHGRTRFYGVDVLLMTVGALAQAFVHSVPALIIVRFVLGLGVGADYVLSPTIMAEQSNARDRGKVIALGFGLIWGIGATIASLLFMALRAAHVPDDVIWRIVLAAGAIPSASVIYLRRLLPETARYLGRIAGDDIEMEEVISEATHDKTILSENQIAGLKDTHPMSYYFQTHWKEFLAACLLWFLFDMVSYSGTLFGPSLIAKGIGLSCGTFQVVMELLFWIPGGLAGIWLIDRWGRKPLQMWGFIGMAVSLIAFAVFQSAALALPVLGMILYGMQNFMAAGGPGSISASGLVGVELAPTKVRTIVQAITVASGRLGATLVAFVFPSLFQSHGEAFAVAVLGILAFIAALITLFGMPETKRKTLEEAAGEAI